VICCVDTDMKRILALLLFLPALGLSQDTLPDAWPRYYTIDGPCNPCVDYPSFVTGCRWFTLLDNPFGGLVHIEAASPRQAYLRVDSAHVRIIGDTVGMVGPVMSGMSLNWLRGGWKGYTFEVGGVYGDSLWINTAYDIQPNPVQWSIRDLCIPLGTEPKKPDGGDQSYWQMPFLLPTNKLEADSKYKVK